jgi:(R,R)-butanediol dehydrogenase/meso-butanediol dehydrogenase/diacetyl reductase
MSYAPADSIHGSDPRVQNVIAWYGPRDVRFERRSLPAEIRAGWVRLEIAWCGICGSDIAEYADGPHAIPPGMSGSGPLGTPLSIVLGHEIAGVVVAAADAQSPLLGARVVTDTLISCGQCPACVRGEVNLCPDLDVAGLTVDGGLARFLDVPEDSCVLVPDNVALDLAALAEPLGVAVRAVERADLTEADSVVVVGLGAVGLMLCLLLGPSRAVGVDPVVTRRIQAQALSKVPTVSSLDEVPANREESRCIIFECTGNIVALNAIVHWSPANGRIVLAGAHPRSARFDLHHFLHAELEMVATLSHSRQDMRTAVEILAADPDRFMSVVSHRIRLVDAPLVLESLARPDTPITKALIGPDGAAWSASTERSVS